MDKEKLISAGEIAKKVKDYAKSIIKKDILLLEIAEKIESKIIELGGRPAFPTNLSINEIAAHYTPDYNDETRAYGLLKVDFGVSIDGWISDTAFSVDLENAEENKKLIEASEKALEKAQEKISLNVSTNEIGKEIQESIESYGFNPVVNLSGHQIDRYDLHAGITIPNMDDNRKYFIEQGVYAIEPFATTGLGKVKDGKPSGIYCLIDEKNPRSSFAREVLNYIKEEYKTLPFCSRWIFKKFAAKTLIALNELEKNNNINQFNQLVEISKSKVSQAENTVLISKKEKIILSG